MRPVTRFAPSPTGFLHIGGARTALFNWLFARHHQGSFLLRIEDTDRARSTDEAIDAIVKGLTWLGLDWDGEVQFQSKRAKRHAAVAQELLVRGGAYHCYCTPEELSEMRERARAEGHRALYDGRWRDRDPSDAPPGIDPVVRLRAPRDGESVIADAVQGEVRVANAQLDDMVLLRSDGTPTYMLSVVVDDHDSQVTHVIRGDDHLTNAFRQAQLFQALEWSPPTFAHIPLIHGPDGAKLSKRHGALGVEAYREMGFLPAAMRNYLLRLGWSHGDAEIISTGDAVAWFDLDAIGRSPSRLDVAKLESVNAHYIREESSEAQLVEMILPLIENRLGEKIPADRGTRLEPAIGSLKQRAKTLVELTDMALFYFRPRPIELTEKAARLLDPNGRRVLADVHSVLANQDTWTEEALEPPLREYAEARALKFGQIAQPLRAALSGSHASPGIFEVMIVLGQEESLGRIADAAA